MPWWAGDIANALDSQGKLTQLCEYYFPLGLDLGAQRAVVLDSRVGGKFPQFQQLLQQPFSAQILINGPGA